MEKDLAINIVYRYTVYMIKSFASQMAQDIFDDTNSRYARKLPKTLHRKAQRLLDQINASTRVQTLNVPPSNKLRRLSGDLKEYWRIKIDKQWAIIFLWENQNAYAVDIVDYH